MRLTPTEWAVLEQLVRNPRRLVTQQTLLTSVWGPTHTRDSGYLRIYLGTLRKKLAGPSEQPWLDLFKLYTQGIRKSFDYRFLVLDSLDALEILAKFREPRREMFSLIRWLRDLHCTSFLLGELPTDRTGGGDPRRPAYAKHKEDYLVDGIFHLRLARQGEFGMQRQLRVVKMRGTRHDTGYHALVFDNGLRVTRILA